MNQFKDMKKEFVKLIETFIEPFRAIQETLHVKLIETVIEPFRAIQETLQKMLVTTSRYSKWSKWNDLIKQLRDLGKTADMLEEMDISMACRLADDENFSRALDHLKKFKIALGSIGNTVSDRE